MGLCGRARAGKDTIAGILKTVFPTLRQVQIGRPVKDASMALFGFSQDQVDGVNKDVVDARYQCTPRELMMWLATAVTEKCGSSHFPDRLGHHRVEAMLRGCSKSPIVITDVRFEHDACLIRKFGGSIIRIVRNIDEVPLAQKFESHTKRVHCDHVLYNDGTLEDLRYNVESLVHTHLINVGQKDLRFRGS
jgi:hypothetical protein